MNGDSAANRGYLVLRRGGVLWGIDNAAVEGLSRRGELFSIRLAQESLSADEILCVVDDLRILPAAAALRRFWPGAAFGVAGLSVHAEQPLVVVDPQRPPALLRLVVEEVEGEGTDGER